MVTETSATQSPLVRLTAMVKTLAGQLAQGDAAALERVRRFFPEAGGGEAMDEHARTTVLRECGLGDWPAAMALLDGRARPGDDYGEFWYEASTDVFLNEWCRGYEEARAVLARRGGWLLPYARQFAVVQAGYIEALGLDSEDPAWDAIGRDLAVPADLGAFQQLALRRLRNKDRNWVPAHSGARVPPGRRAVYAFRCTASGEVWVDWALNLEAVRNGLWFFLRHGHHPDASLQAAWNRHGEACFVFEVLDEFDAELPGYRVQKLLAERKRHWIDALGAGDLLF